MRRVVVTGAGGSPAANFVHSLRLAPEPFYVVGTDTSKFHLELAPVDARYLVPPTDVPRYLDELRGVVVSEQAELVHPQPEQEVLALSRDAEHVGAATFLPAPEAVELCQDKAAFGARMADAGLPAPRFARGESEEQLCEATDWILAERERAWVRAIRGAGARASLPVSSGEQAGAWVRYWIEEGLTPADFMVSELLPGREFAFQSLWRDGDS